jgi:colanic acid/amylovoran biosynthesis protein
MISKKAIIVNGITDMNKGDQALVWESYRIIQDTKVFDNIKVISLGDTPNEYEALCGQTIGKGIDVIQNLLQHPRRGKHHKDKLQKEGLGYLLFQVKNALTDYISLSFLKLIISNKKLTSFFFSEKYQDTIEAFRGVDTVFVKGGGFLHAHGEKTAPYTMWYFFYYMNLAKQLSKQLVILPNSYGPFDGLTVKRQFKKGLGKSDLILSREQVSSDALSKLLNKEIPVVPDLGFYLNMNKEDDGRDILYKYGFKKEDKIVGITVRPWRFSGFQNPEELFENYLKSLKNVIEVAIEKGLKVALFNQSIGPNAHEDDRNAILKLIDICDNENTNMFTWVNENPTCDVLKSVYSNMYFFIGTRFHSLIFSMTSEVPSISIAYGGNKGVGIMKEFGLEDYVIKINEVTEESLLKIFVNALENYAHIKRCLSDKLPSLEEDRMKTIELIKRAVL